jgi:hypothetical protein
MEQCIYNEQWKTACNTLMPKLVQIIFKNSVRTSKEARHFTTEEVQWLILLKEIIVVHIDNHMKNVSKKCRITIVKAGGTYNYRWALNG